MSVGSDGVIDILIAGVGGQGVLLASEVISRAAMMEGFDVKKSEVHGMSQRGGSVTSHVRFGPKVFSPLIPAGEADILLAFEKLEALRWLDFLREDGLVIVNDQEIPPLPVVSGMAEYPKDIIGSLRGRRGRVMVVEGAKIALRAGNLRVVNSALLGALAVVLPIDIGRFEEALRNCVSPKFLQVNLDAFRMGTQNTLVGGASQQL
ncbi:MAG: indolepyruvate oxidoreductase subunit beta [bacterium]